MKQITQSEANLKEILSEVLETKPNFSIKEAGKSIILRTISTSWIDDYESYNLTLWKLNPKNN